MQPWRKGKQLLARCGQKMQREQRILARHIHAQQLQLEQIQQSKTQLKVLNDAVEAQHLVAVSVNKSALYQQRRQQSVLLSEIQKLRVAHVEQAEQLATIELSMGESRQVLAELTRQEMKFSRWTQLARKVHRARQALSDENEIEEGIACQSKFN